MDALRLGITKVMSDSYRLNHYSFEYHETLKPPAFHVQNMPTRVALNELVT